MSAISHAMNRIERKVEDFLLALNLGGKIEKVINLPVFCLALSSMNLANRIPSVNAKIDRLVEKVILIGGTYLGLNRQIFLAFSQEKEAFIQRVLRRTKVNFTQIDMQKLKEVAEQFKTCFSRFPKQTEYLRSLCEAREQVLGSSFEEAFFLTQHEHLSYFAICEQFINEGCEQRVMDRKLKLQFSGFFAISVVKVFLFQLDFLSPNIISESDNYF